MELPFALLVSILISEGWLPGPMRRERHRLSILEIGPFLAALASLRRTLAAVDDFKGEERSYRVAFRSRRLGAETRVPQSVFEAQPAGSSPSD